MSDSGESASKASSKRDELVSTIKRYHDASCDTQLYIYFRAASASDLFMRITDGVEQHWQLNINTDHHADANDDEQFLAELHQSLTRGSFELRRVYGAKSEPSIEFKILAGDQRKKLRAATAATRILLEPLGDTYKAEMKTFVFSLVERIHELTSECDKLRKRTLPNSAQQQHTPSASTSSQQQQQQQSAAKVVTMNHLRKFNLMGASKSVQINRRQGMSIINPMCKRRQAPKGVQFDKDDDDDDDNNQNDDDDHEDNDDVDK